MQTSKVLRNGWKFYRGSVDTLAHNQDAVFENVRIPHDWAIEGPFDAEHDVHTLKIKEDGEPHEYPHYGRTGSLPHVGQGLYQRDFFVASAAEGQSVFLEFDGVMSHSTIWVNGAQVGGRPFGYASFSVDITDAVEFGVSNVVVVGVDNPPLASRWYPGAGIIRDVRLVIKDKEHFAYSGVWLKTLAIDLAKATADLMLCTEHTAADDATVRLTLSTMDGREVLQQTGCAKGNMRVRLNECEFWSPDEPSLYHAVVELMRGDTVLDAVEFDTGVRQLEFIPAKGMILNGNPFMFKGVCLHHDHGALGAAFSKPAMARQLRILQGIGVNAIRTSHNPPAPEVLELCDRMGFAVMDEAFDAWKDAKIPNDYSKDYEEWHARDLVDMIKRDRNHPSVFLWSVGNEIHEQNLPGGDMIARGLVEMCHQTDPTRLVSAGMNYAYNLSTGAGFPEQLDVLGWNYKPKIYQDLYELFPHKPHFGAETASTTSTRGHYEIPYQEIRTNYAHESNQCSGFDNEGPRWSTSPDTEFAAHDVCPWIAGEFVWTGFDYLGEPTPYNRNKESHSSYFGIFDLAGLPKDRAWLYKARWREGQETVLHVLPHWTWPDYVGKSIPVAVYTNCASVKLFVNGKCVGEGQLAKGQYRYVWEGIAYESGELVAVGYSANGIELMTDCVVTAGDATQLKLSVDRSVIRADGDDLAYITVDVCDAAGAIVPDADTQLDFEVTGAGELVGVCNGDPTSYESLKGSTMKAFHGKCVCIVRAKGEAGEITVTIRATDNVAQANVQLATY